ncbi:MAG: acylphosphatase [Candidatus Bathyarchaeia archaeon]
MIRARLVVEGDVQKVGFRDYVQKMARKLGVKGYVENLPDGTVQIICEAEPPVLEDFVKAINVAEEFIKVENVNVVEKSGASGEFEFFEIKYGKLEEELGERLGTAVEYAKATRAAIREMHEDIKGTRTDIKEMHEDIKGTRTDIKEMHENIKTAIKEMHVDLKSSIENMRMDLKGSTEEIRKDLKDGIMGIQSEVKGMRIEMNERFDEMARRYDFISAELVRTREELTRAVDGLLKLVEEFIRGRRREEP